MMPAKLPRLLDTKIYKTGQTRGADDDQIFQNRVSRSSTVLIPYNIWEIAASPPAPDTGFAKGFIALISPNDYFETPEIESVLSEKGLELGQNCVVFYQKRSDWLKYHPDSYGWEVANTRMAPIGGQYVARIAANTALEGGDRINMGFNSSTMKGAGIRAFEYASPTTIKKCRIQLEAIFWMCIDADFAVGELGMLPEEREERKKHILTTAENDGLLDMNQLITQRIINADNQTICPLCLDPLSAIGFVSMLEQAEGRQVHDLTVTAVNLFHIKEVRYGEYNHRPYNLGWGHHHCNVVVKDSGIDHTIEWMRDVIKRNDELQD